MAKKKSTKKATKKTASKKATKKTKSGRKPSAAFMAPLRPSDALGEIVGFSPLARTQAVKKLWAYIKKHKLQDRKNRRMINPDSKLGKVFGTMKSVNMFSMMKPLKKHLKKI